MRLLRGRMLSCWLLAGVVCFASVFPAVAAVPSRKTERRARAKFIATYDRIRRMYVDEVDMAPLVDDAIRGMLAALDPHTEYVAAEEMERFRALYRGKFGGIGIKTFRVRDSLVVTEVSPGSPAEEAGIRPDDRIVRVDGREMGTVSDAEVTSVLRGEVGTKFRAEVVRRDTNYPLLFEMTRREITLPSVEVACKPDSATGYVRIARFSNTTAPEFERTYVGLGSPENLILDLRGNGGGVFSQAVALVDFFLPKGALIVSTEGRGIPETRYEAGRAPGFPENGRLVVLIDEQSASASEIVSGALQDWDRAIVVGRRSFGKGLVQRQYPLSDGSVLRLVVARYRTPSGRMIQRPYVKGGDRSAYRSAELPDTASLPAFRTLRSGRTVYGGGGIVPDVTVARSASEEGYLIALGQDVLVNFIQDCLDRYRKEWMQSFPDLETFAKQFEVPVSLYEDLVLLGCDRGVVPPDAGGVEEGEVLRKLKVLFADRLFGQAAVLCLQRIGDDKDLARALGVLQNWTLTYGAVIKR